MIQLSLKFLGKELFMGHGIEDGVGFHYYEDIKAIAKKLGYPSLKVAIISEYEKHGGLIKTAEVFKVTRSTILNKLRGYKYDKVKPRGGPNNPTGITKKIQH